VSVYPVHRGGEAGQAQRQADPGHPAREVGKVALLPASGNLPGITRP
jgi:hypothetical protein